MSNIDLRSHFLTGSVSRFYIKRIKNESTGRWIYHYRFTLISDKNIEYEETHDHWMFKSFCRSFRHARSKKMRNQQVWQIPNVARDYIMHMNNKNWLFFYLYSPVIYMKGIVE